MLDLRRAPANAAPSGTNNLVTTPEDTAFTFTAANFGFTDPNDSPANSLAAVKIATLPTAGTLTNNGVDGKSGQHVKTANINAGQLRFTPAINASGVAYASFTFQVQDDGGTANGGVDTDPIPNTLTINVTPVNEPPSGSNNTVATPEDTAFTFTAANFGFTDPNDSPANSLAAVKIATLPTAGTLTNNGVAVGVGQPVLAANINAGQLRFTPAINASGVAYASFTFQVQDDGGTANGGVDTDPTPNTLTFNVTPVNDPPSGSNNMVTTPEDTAFTFTVANFGFTDPNDSPANSLAAVKISPLPTLCPFTNNGVAVTAGQPVPAANIIAGQLRFTPAVNASG